MSNSVPEGKKINPGAVEAIAEQPGDPENVLIGYRRGLMVLWNKKTSMAVQVTSYCACFFITVVHLDISFFCRS